MFFNDFLSNSLAVSALRLGAGEDIVQLPGGFTCRAVSARAILVFSLFPFQFPVLFIFICLLSFFTRAKFVLSLYSCDPTRQTGDSFFN